MNYMVEENSHFAKLDFLRIILSIFHWQPPLANLETISSSRSSWMNQCTDNARRKRIRIDNGTEQIRINTFHKHTIMDENCIILPVAHNANFTSLM
jgi:hypothetical protein